MRPQEHIKYLSGSPYRPEILSVLCEDALRPAELTDEIDVTRTTIQRVLRGFTERNWIVKRNGAYCATATGQRLWETYETLSQEVERAETYGPLAVNAREIADALAPEIFTRTTATLPTNRNPLAPLERYFAVCAEVETAVHQMAPIVTTEAIEMIDDVLSDEIPVRLLIDTELYETIQQQYGCVLRRWNADPHISLGVSELPIKYGLSILDETVIAGSVDQGQNIEIIVEGTDPELLEKTTKFYETRWAESTPLSTLLSE